MMGYTRRLFVAVLLLIVTCITTTGVPAAPAQYVVPPSLSALEQRSPTSRSWRTATSCSSAQAAPVSMDYAIFDNACPGCIDQIQVGFNTANPTDCICILGMPERVAPPAAQRSM